MNVDNLEKACASMTPAEGSIADPGNECPSGYLLKAGEGGMLRSSSLKNRWFTYDKHAGLLAYYKTKGVKKASGVIPTADMQSVEFAEERGRVLMNVITPKRTYSLTSSSSKDLVHWAVLLRREIAAMSDDVNKTSISHARSNNYTIQDCKIRSSSPTSLYRASISGEASQSQSQSQRSKRTSVVMSGLTKMLSKTVKSDTVVRPPGTVPASVFSVIFQNGPLYLDMEADEQDRPSVLTFDRKIDGSMGPAEACGKLKIGDALIACNDESLIGFSFQDAITIVVNQPWPRKMTFERPPKEPIADAEGWMYKQGDSAKSTLRRRFFKLYNSNLFYYKPSRLNAANPHSSPTGSIQIQTVTEIKLIQDKQNPGSGEFRLELVTEARKWVLCPSSLEGLNYWSSAIQSCGNDGMIVHELTIIERIHSSKDTSSGLNNSRTSKLSDGELTYNGDVARKDYFMANLRRRHLKLYTNCLRFYHFEDDVENYHIDIQDLAKVQRILRLEEKQHKDWPEAIVLILKNGNVHEFRVQTDNIAEAWVSALRKLASPHGTKFVTKEESASAASMLVEALTGEEKDYAAEERDTQREEEGVLLGNSSATLEGIAEGGNDVDDPSTTEVGHIGRSRSNTKSVEQCGGWMYKLGERKLGATSGYRKRWFSLRNGELSYFKYREDDTSVFNRGKSGSVSFKTVLEVRRSRVSGCPDNTIEIATPSRIYTLVPACNDDKDDVFYQWLRELTNAADVYGSDMAEAQKAEAKRIEDDAREEATRQEKVRTSLVQAGMLLKKGQVMKTMKSRYFALVGHTLSYYASEEDLYSQDDDAIGSIGKRIGVLNIKQFLKYLKQPNRIITNLFLSFFFGFFTCSTTC